MKRTSISILSLLLVFALLLTSCGKKKEDVSKKTDDSQAVSSDDSVSDNSQASDNNFDEYEEGDYNSLVSGSIDSEDYMVDKDSIEKAPEFSSSIRNFLYDFKGGADAQADAMRKKILNAKDELEPGPGGTIYYFSQKGDNDNDGLSPDTPKKDSIFTQNLSFNKQLKEGDLVLFERGGMWRIDTGCMCVNGVKYGAYGTGEKPVITSSEMDFAQESLWVPTTKKNVWKLDYFVRTSIAPLVYNFGAQAGAYKINLKLLKKDGDYYQNRQTNELYVYCSKGNPGKVYDSIEMGRNITRFFCFPKDSHDITIDNFKIVYSNHVPVHGDGYVKNITITNCEMGWVGGALYYPEYADNAFVGGTILEFWNGGDNIRIENNWFYEGTDIALAFEGYAPGDGSGPIFCTNINIKNNLFEYNGTSIELWSNGDDNLEAQKAIHDNINIEGNISRFAGYCSQLLVREPHNYDMHISLGWYKLFNLKNFVVQNNIFDGTQGRYFMWGWSDGGTNYNPLDGLLFKNNEYYDVLSLRNYNDAAVLTYGGNLEQASWYAKTKDEFLNVMKKLEPGLTADRVHWIQ